MSPLQLGTMETMHAECLLLVQLPPSQSVQRLSLTLDRHGPILVLVWIYLHLVPISLVHGLGVRRRLMTFLELRW